MQRTVGVVDLDDEGGEEDGRTDEGNRRGWLGLVLVCYFITGSGDQWSRYFIVVGKSKK